MLKIYGNPMSTCTRKVLTTLAEMNMPFEMSAIDLAGGQHKQEAHLRRQPFGRIPALEDDGFELFESRAMSRYLNEKGGGKLIPSDAKARAKMEQWISVETSEFYPHAMKYIYNYTFKRPQEPAVLEAAGKALEVTCAVMEKQLAKTPYLAGGEFTLADIGFMPYIEYLMPTPAKDILSKHPHLMAWWSKISERPSWRKVAGKA
jgi:glutathione S-transferase